MDCLSNSADSKMNQCRPNRYNYSGKLSVSVYTKSDAGVWPSRGARIRYADRRLVAPLGQLHEIFCNDRFDLSTMDRKLESLIGPGVNEIQNDTKCGGSSMESSTKLVDKLISLDDFRKVYDYCVCPSNQEKSLTEFSRTNNNDDNQPENSPKTSSWIFDTPPTSQRKNDRNKGWAKERGSKKRRSNESNDDRCWTRVQAVPEGVNLNPVESTESPRTNSCESDMSDVDETGAATNENSNNNPGVSAQKYGPNQAKVKANLVALVDSMEPKNYIDYLIQEDALSFDEADEIETMPTRKERARRIIKILMLKNDNSVLTLVNAMKINKDKHLVNLLQD